MSEPVNEDRVRLMIAEAINSALLQHETKIMQHLDSGFDRLTQSFASAFPGGDPHGHRLAHEKAIRDASGWAKLKAEVIGRFLTAGLWAAAVFLAFAAWEAVKSNFQGRT
jgi:hypothetical protein